MKEWLIQEVKNGFILTRQPERLGATRDEVYVFNSAFDLSAWIRTNLNQRKTDDAEK